jgi:hypothetical protein
MLHEKVAQLEMQVDWLKKKLFGGGQGESMDKAQMLLKLELLEKTVCAAITGRANRAGGAWSSPKANCRTWC